MGDGLTVFISVLLLGGSLFLLKPGVLVTFLKIWEKEIPPWFLFYLEMAIFPFKNLPSSPCLEGKYVLCIRSTHIHFLILSCMLQPRIQSHKRKSGLGKGELGLKSNLNKSQPFSGYPWTAECDRLLSRVSSEGCTPFLWFQMSIRLEVVCKYNVMLPFPLYTFVL